MGIKTLQPEKKSDFDPNFRTQVEAQITQGQGDYDSLKDNTNSVWLMPDNGDWGGSLLDWEGIGEAFNRDDANQMYIDATSDVQSPGRRGDLIVATTQLDYLSMMERAFRARHCQGFARSVAHTLGRRKGHGADQGPFKLSTIGYVKALLRRTAQKRT